MTNGSSLPAEVIAHYDARGACETEIQADKGGLLLSRRRKKVLAAQETLVLLTRSAKPPPMAVRKTKALPLPALQCTKK